MPNIFIIDLLGIDILEEEKILLQDDKVGGLLLFTRNFKNSEQLQKLVADVQSIRPDIMIAVDHEGGIVQRFQRHGFRSLPAARVYGDVYDINPDAGIQLAKQYGQVMAEDVLQYGIDLSLAPVLDVHDVSTIIAGLDRAFHRDPDVIAKLAGAFIDGMNQAGMPAVGKHYPGHGSIVSDSHISMPVSHASKAELLNQDLKPFITLMNEHKLGGVMPAHVTYSAIDPQHAAGFSKIWLKDILCGDLQFNGLVISDCLGMAGADIGNLSARAMQALAAGCHMLIVCNQSRSIMTDLLQSVNWAQSPEDLQRIARFKNSMRRFSPTKIGENKPFLSANSDQDQQSTAMNSNRNQTFNNTTSI